MKCLSRDACQEVARWIYQNARPLELLTWQYLFEDGDQKRVVDVLTIYQNADGGFGHALEPDNWNPESSPYTTHYAISENWWKVVTAIETILLLREFNRLVHGLMNKE